VIPPRFQTTQNRGLDWLVEAQVRPEAWNRSFMEALFDRYGALTDDIASRATNFRILPQRWDNMSLFGPKGSDIGMKNPFFRGAREEIFRKVVIPPGGTAERSGACPPARIRLSSVLKRLVSLRHGQADRGYHGLSHGLLRVPSRRPDRFRPPVGS